MKALKRLGVLGILGVFGLMALGLLSTVLADSQTAVKATPAKAFELWPATNDAAPTTFTKEAPPFEKDGKPWKFKYGPKVQLKIDASQVLHNVTPYQFGNNVAWWDHKDWFMDPDRIEKAKEAGIRFWRWPGGSSSDNYFWDGKYGSHTKDSNGGNPTNMTDPWAVSTDDFINFCKQTTPKPLSP